MNVSGNTILITGGASGIGLAFAKQFLESRNTVIICGRNINKLEQIKKQYSEINIIHCDITKDREVQKMKEQIQAKFPQLNLLINNAGIQHQLDFENDTEAIEKIDEEMAVNFRAVLYLTKCLLPILQAVPKSAIINVSSLLGIIPKKSAPGYCATKAALHAFSESLRYQLTKTSVKVFEIITPIVATDMTMGREESTRKMMPEALAKSVFYHLKKNHYEIRPGQTNKILLLNRLFPSLIMKIFQNR